jgi:hypothetical protein
MFLLYTKKTNGNMKMKKIIALTCALFSAGNIASAMDPEDQSALINESRFYLAIDLTDMGDDCFIKYTTPEINNFFVAASNIYRGANPDMRVSSLESEFNHFFEFLEPRARISRSGWHWSFEDSTFINFSSFLRRIYEIELFEIVATPEQSRIIFDLENDGNICMPFDGYIISLMDAHSSMKCNTDL